MTDSAAPRILVPQPIHADALALLRRHGNVELVESERMMTREELKRALASTDYFLSIGDYALDEDILSANPELKGISAIAGHPEEWIDLEAATRLGIPVTGLTRGPVLNSTAELTMALILALSLRIIEADRSTRAGGFRQEQSITLMTRSLVGKQLGLIGFAGVARAVARRAAPFDLQLSYTKRTRLDAATEAEFGLTWVPQLDDLLAQSDIVSIHAEHNASTDRLIGARELALMKPTAFLINTARGRILDEPALIDALRRRVIGGAGLDVYVNEPPVTFAPDPDPRFFDLDNVILIPHLGGATEETLAIIARLGAENLVALIKGERPASIVNPAALSARAH